MHIAIKFALGAFLLIGFSACQKQHQNRLSQPQGNIRQLQSQQCILQKQQRISQAARRQTEAKIQQSYCLTDACQDYWRAKEAEAYEDYNQAIQEANSLNCFLQ